MSIGIKVSRQGYDVHTASDKQLAFTSEWPLLPIEAEGTFDITTSSSYDEDITTHNLGYVPVFMIWVETSSKKYCVGSAFPYNIYATTTKLHIADTAFDTGTIHYKIFRRPLLTEYDAGNLISTDATEKDSGDLGLIVSLPGEDVSSTDKRDFGVRSDMRQLMIHKTGYFDNSTNGANVTHNLGYKPMYWFYTENTFYNPAGAYSIQSQTDDFIISATDTTLTYTFYGYPWLQHAYLIFKDPLNEAG